MNREAIRKLYDHADYAWGQVTQILAREGGDILTREAPGSGWPTLRNCLAHYLFAYERWLAILTSEPQSALSETVQTLTEIDSARSGFRRQIDSLLNSLSDEELQTVREFRIDEDRMPYSYAELITHVALHERGHHGDITTLFWRLGIEIPALDYRFHLRRTPL
jgi:uncharacterized damage-inducible protein DinB